MAKKQPKYFEDWFEIGTYDTEGKARQVKASKKRAKYSFIHRMEIRKASKKYPSGMRKGGFTLWGIGRIKNVTYKGKK
jgi:hypothetical protein